MKKGEKRRSELLGIAYKKFLAQGYENTSVDEIIKAAGIAKGTFYYYFTSKEQMLEEVIVGMIAEEAEAAERVLSSQLSVPQKILGIIAAVRPAQDEQHIKEVLNRPENVLMHKKIGEHLFNVIVPLLSRAVEEGVQCGLFDCDHIPERVRMLLVLSSELFDKADFTAADADVFIDVMEKLLGAAPGTMGLIHTILQ